MHAVQYESSSDFVLDTKLITLKSHHAAWIRTAAEVLTAKNIANAWRPTGIMRMFDSAFKEEVVALGGGGPAHGIHF